MLSVPVSLSAEVLVEPFKQGPAQVKVGQRVEFTVVQGQKGLQAQDVMVI